MPIPAAPSSAPPDGTGSADWRASAACAGLPPQVVFSTRPAQALPALSACGGCPVRQECEETIAPADTWFDGVCAGRLWRNGRPVATTPDTDGSPRD
jgi:WhiB family redox-sensing transcriptional regulator